MTDRPFAHLHCHSHYSLLDGAASIDRLVHRASELGMSALALTDHGNLHGALEFYRKAKGAGLNPIIGYEAYIAPGSRFQKDAGNMRDASYHLTLLAQNRTGFRNLVKMASAASLEGFYFKPRIDKELLEAHQEGVICLSGCVSGEFSRALLKGQDAKGHLDNAMEVAAWFHKTFGERYFIEVMNNGVEVQRLALEGSVEVANRMGLPLVATSDTHYVNPEDAEAQDVMLCINTGKFRTDSNRMRMDGRQYFLRSPEQMYECFPNLEDAVSRSQEIADSVDIDLELGKRHFPTYRLPGGETAEDKLRELCLSGLRERYAGDPEMLPDGELSEIVMARLDRELAVINKLGFPNYFLICWDFVHKAREMGIPATARGSGVGALVCFALYLSHVCPIKYDLLFERFLDESRLEAPDIDIDFCKERRSEVIRYVKEKYGEANVAQIGTFGTLAAKQAIRDVGRAMGMPLARVNQVVEMVPDELKITLEKALVKSDDLKKAYASEPEDPRAARSGQEARGSGPQCRHARRGRRDRRPAAHRVCSLGHGHRQDRHHHAVVDGRCGSGRPAEDGLSGSPQPDDPLQGRRTDHSDDRQDDRSAQVPSGRQRDVRFAMSRRNQGHLSTGKRRHSRSAAEDEARSVLGHHRHQCTLSPGPAGRRDGR